MKHTLFLLFTFLFLGLHLSLHAQEENNDKVVNFGIKGGFNSSLFVATDLIINGEEIHQMQHAYKLGYFGTVFMRINFGHHFLQPEATYSVSRCDITFPKPLAEEGSTPQKSTIAATTYSIEFPVLYGYNFIKHEHYRLAGFIGPKIRYNLNNKSDLTFENFDQHNISEELYPINLSLTLGVAVTMSRVFLDFRYDLGLHNISKSITYYPANADQLPEFVPAKDQIRFHRHDNTLSFSFGLFF